MPYYSHDDEVHDFDEYVPTPYGGGYDQALTYGRPLEPSDETCYPSSSDQDEYERPDLSSYSEPSAYADEALNDKYSSYPRFRRTTRVRIHTRSGTRWRPASLQPNRNRSPTLHWRYQWTIIPRTIILRQFRHLDLFPSRWYSIDELHTENPNIGNQSEQLLMVAFNASFLSPGDNLQGLRLNHLRDTDTRGSLHDLDATLLNPTQLNHRTTEQASLMSPPDSLPELSQAESERESSLESIFQRLGQFCERHIKWRQLVSVTADMDVFVLAIASDYYEGRPTCRPVIKSASDEVPLFANSLGHPVIRSDPLGKVIFVPNDITLGGTGHASFLLLTGPNMGRKSTLRGQVCLSVILTQLGADMPVKSFELSLVDPILVRMGAKDHIMSSATRKSLVAPDELGRGMSTSDRQAIAQSLLQHFVDKVHCRGTHVDYQNYSQVSLCHMSCQVGNGDGGVEEVTFLYRLTRGACPKIYVVNIASLAGLPRSVLQKAAAKAKEFEAAYYKHLVQTEDSFPLQTSIEKMVECIQMFTNTVAKLTCQESSEETDVDFLILVGQNARLLEP